MHSFGGAYINAIFIFLAIFFFFDQRLEPKFIATSSCHRANVMIVIAVAMLVIEVNPPLLNIFAPVKAVDLSLIHI